MKKSLVSIQKESLHIKEITDLINRDPDLRIIRDRNLVLRYRKHFKQGGQKVVLVGGVYDMLHDGHAGYLLRCLKLGDILIVALDDDALTRKRKNDPRKPFDSEMDRARMLCFACLAHIVTFRSIDEHPYDLIKLLRPDILVTSETTADVSNRDRKLLKPYCGEVIVLPPQSSNSTTAKFKRFAEMQGSAMAEKMLSAMNELFKPLNITFNAVETKNDKRVS
ncbi:MAG: hypothetical protein A3I21_01290 [Candidatus Zambryskibacteria bacterium RIFCSPLOWO2_02_FULL_39_69]|uniref:Cytidyltransferase-like domain-containing protein n=1 Tax=Candidatus Zambryskibacteria bacterium RIFCSPHIGHO2_02_38_10.5 TaxID=1802742 RepID=A0A1G2T8Y4_9BACT|nr:MAG: hypothetical protein A2W58_01705 [Candidatus Zambryskibacteria bacterium RIFCSPHIGHO2_02_38_10.5]OHB08823.1 MAG: hypothetical protein A2W64_02805 [Candidatus Zambryskibacteria bacterium RIFCSPLOWO2_02_39_10]OHB10274.1 MAG: hypothetical protein A3I21_01290 [Candidatus Zambryskibacteria bacterium RIFCSPLOWO2_02_FULL_39_69]